MIVYILSNNTAINPEFEVEHGFSLFIKTDKHNILVDSGCSDIFIKNAKKLRLDLEAVDICVLTHGHFEHGGGLTNFLDINKKAKIYSNCDVFGKYYNDKKEYIGLGKDLKKYQDRFVFIEDEYFINNNLEIFSGNDRKTISPIRATGFSAKSNHNFTPDDFHHEQYLVISEKKGPKLLVTGCSHKGINNIMNWSRYMNIDYVIGGFHLKDFDLKVLKTKRNLDLIINDLNQYKAKYYTCHCTGLEQYSYMKEQMPNNIFLVSAGEIINIV